ncbi:MAG: YdbH domain-containing protein, partial [Rhodospirillales bacterium]|nr:YdbH domain-containing protein [Rhodospirillales bacterium]
KVENGLLMAQAPGALRYRPRQPPGALASGGTPAGMVLQALGDFRYATLEMTVNGRTGGETVIGLKVSGANPGFLEGYPVELNLTVSGQLDRILSEALTGYEIPAKIRDRMTEFGMPDQEEPK